MDDLPLLLPSDPQNRLSKRTRRRILRAHVEGDTFQWEAEDSILSQHLDSYGVTAGMERSKANLKKARHVLAVMRSEFSKLGLKDNEYRECMNTEIDAAANSLQLNDAQRRLLESQFFFPEEITTPPPEAPSANVAQQSGEIATVGTQILTLREECRWTIEDLAQAVNLHPVTVSRHHSGEITPRPRTLTAYERVFSKKLQRQVVINKTLGKR